jgi:hypothetical protein
MDALQVNENNMTYTLGEPKKLNKHAICNYLEPFVGDIYSENNTVAFINKEDKGGCIEGDLVTWTKNYVGEKYSGEYKDQKYVKVKFDSTPDLIKGDVFKCLTKSPYLINDKIKFTIKKYKKIGEKEEDISKYCKEAIGFLNL